MKLALVEQEYWLKGAKHAIEVITDHRNLEYLSEVKRLNTRQACWTLFTRFNFTVIYRPGIKNQKVDALSHVYHPESDTAPPGSILSPAIIVSLIEWSIYDQKAESTC